MVDKHRHSRTLAPRGSLSGRAFALFLACAAVVAAGLARTIA